MVPIQFFDSILTRKIRDKIAILTSFVDREFPEDIGSLCQKVITEVQEFAAILSSFKEDMASYASAIVTQAREFETSLIAEGDTSEKISTITRLELSIRDIGKLGNDELFSQYVSLVTSLVYQTRAKMVDEVYTQVLPYLRTILPKIMPRAEATLKTK